MLSRPKRDRHFLGIDPPDETDRADRNNATGTVIDGLASRYNVTSAVIYKPAPVDLITS